MFSALATMMMSSHFHLDELPRHSQYSNYSTQCLLMFTAYQIFTADCVLNIVANYMARQLISRMHYHITTHYCMLFFHLKSWFISVIKARVASYCKLVLLQPHPNHQFGHFRQNSYCLTLPIFLHRSVLQTLVATVESRVGT